MINLAMVSCFTMGYFLVTTEHITKINKATIVILLGVALWLLQFQNPSFSYESNSEALTHHLAEISQIVFFLFGALTVVETINVHNGFSMISNLITIRTKKQLLWIVGFITFFLSSVLDNLTTTIVMVSLLRKFLDDKNDRWIVGAGVVIAANAGGAWTPIGDVTTTMLWIGGQLSTIGIIKNLFLPSFACFIASFLSLQTMLKGRFTPPLLEGQDKIEPYGRTLFFLGIGSLIFVPVFKVLTGLPPYMGILLALGVLWLVTDILHAPFQERNHLRVPFVLTKIDFAGVLFFLGILLAVQALETAGLLTHAAHYMNEYVGNISMIAVLIGLISSIVDNVPLVAASMSMYDLESFAPDHYLWELIAYCAGTGGSILIIGSAAGVVFMGLESVDFAWYLRRISLTALTGYFAGLATYWILH